MEKEDDKMQPIENKVNKLINKYGRKAFNTVLAEQEIAEKFTDLELEFIASTGVEIINEEGKYIGDLQLIFALQNAFDQKLIATRGLQDITQQQWIINELMAMSSEIEEVRDEVGWKWWKQQPEINWDEVRNEMIDIVHFLTAGMLHSGMQADEALKRYINKNVENYKRQKGTTKDATRSTYKAENFAKDVKDIATAYDQNNGIGNESYAIISFVKTTGVIELSDDTSVGLYQVNQDTIANPNIEVLNLQTGETDLLTVLTSVELRKMLTQ